MEAVFAAYVDVEFRHDCQARERDHDGGEGGMLSRTAAQRRFDALLAIFRAAAEHGAAAGRHAGEGSPGPVPVVVNLIGDVATFMTALAEHGLVPPPDPELVLDPMERRCETAGGAVVLADDVVRAALHGHVRRVVVDSAGVVIDWGRRRRLFTGAARQAAKLLVRRCQRLGCGVAAEHADVDHHHAWSSGGPTDQHNAGVLCRHDNQAKHQLGLTVHRTADGYLTWRDSTGQPLTPAGRRHLPDDHDTDHAIRHRIDTLIAEREHRDRQHPPDR